MEKYILPNDLTVYYYPVKSSYSVCIGLYISVGSRYETVADNGISHLLEHMHFRRLGDMTQKELYYETDIIGTTLRATTYRDFTRYYMKLVPRHLRRGAEFFKKILEVTQWTDADVENEKKVVQNQLREKEEFISIGACRDLLLWKENALAYPVTGEMESVHNISLNDLVAFKKRHYRSEKTALVITGQISNSDMLFLNAFFSAVSIDQALIENDIIATPVVGKRKPDIHFYRSTSDYLDVSISFDVSNAIRREVITILNSILGDGTSSKLEQSLREEMGITANIYSDAQEYQDVMVINIFFSVDKGDLYTALKKIVEIINEMKNQILDADLATNLPFFTDNLYYLLEDTDVLNFNLGWDLHVKKEPIYTIEDRIKSYCEVSKEALIHAAKTIFTEKNASIVVIGALNRITKKEIKQIFSLLG